MSGVPHSRSPVFLPLQHSFDWWILAKRACWARNERACHGEQSGFAERVDRHNSTTAAVVIELLKSRAKKTEDFTTSGLTISVIGECHLAL